jgi:hypothetical protein
MKRNVILLVVAVTVCAICIVCALAQEWPATSPQEQWDFPPTHFRGPDGRQIGPQVTQDIPVLLQRLEHTRQIHRLFWETTLNPEKAGVVAVLQLENEFRQSLTPEETVKILQDLLKGAKTQGLRNMLRVAIKDLCKRQGNSSQAIEQMVEMFKENDQALQQGQKTDK